MVQSTIPNEWLQPLVAEKVAELRNVENETEYEPQRNHFFIQVDGTKYTCKELVHIIRSYGKARDTLIYYAGIAYDDLLREWENRMHRARETLEEIEDAKRNDE